MLARIHTSVRNGSRSGTASRSSVNYTSSNTGGFSSQLGPLASRLLTDNGLVANRTDTIISKMNSTCSTLTQQLAALAEFA